MIKITIFSLMTVTTTTTTIAVVTNTNTTTTIAITMINYCLMMYLYEWNIVGDFPVKHMLSQVTLLNKWKAKYFFFFLLPSFYFNLNEI